jgi:hypothetical protein
MLANDELPPLPPHPEPHTMRWTRLELDAIREYARAVERAAYAAAIKACEEIESERWKQYKGRDENDAERSLRGNQHTEGCSDGASECAAATEAQIEQHPDDAAVDRFAAAMKAKLAEKRDEGRGGWDDPAQCSTGFLAWLLRGHVEKGDPLDVGNFAMMLWNRGGATNEMRAALAQAKEGA